MKRILHIHQRYILTSVLLALCLNMVAQNRATFKARSQENHSQQIRTTLTTSDTIALEGMGTIYSFSIDATIFQPREASFTRIVLEDTEGHDYLVAESDWFRFDTTTVNLDRYCEETALLEGITPLRLKCYLAGDVTLTLNGIHLSSQPATRKTGSPEETVESIKLSQVQDIVDRINTYNRKHHKLWKAFPNKIAQSLFNNRPSIFQSNDAYFSNLIYYDKGIYEIGEPSDHIVGEKSSTEQCIDSFDWRQQHGRDWWITTPKNQGLSGYCTAFASAGAMEGMANLFYNKNLALDLSEQDIAYYAHINYQSGANTGSIVSWVVNNGIIDEATLPFQDTPNPSMPPSRPQGNYKAECLSTSSCDLITVGEDSIKKFLINKGPCVSGFHTDWPAWHDNCHSHAMVLTGYGKVEPSIMYYFVYTWEVDTILHENDWRIGKTFWIFKNSYYENGHDIYDHGHNGYMYIIFNKPELMNTVHSINYPISITGYSILDIVCEDLDGDGYFNWGIGPRPDHCPEWAPDEPDGDDSDATLGPMDEYGYIAPIQTDSTIYIDVNTQYSNGSLHLSNNICIRNGSTLTISCDLLMNRLAEIRIKPGSKLIVTGTIRNANIKPEPGSTLILNDGGRIITHAKDEFSVPVGAHLEINEGSVE